MRRMLIEIIHEEIAKFMDFLIEAAREELRAQGHVATGQSLRNITKEVYVNLGGVSGAKIYVPDHLIILDRGVRASRVPYGGRTGGGGMSRYIAALIQWLATVRGGSIQERKKIAFSIAAAAKKEGHPTSGSYKYSTNGRRKGWSQEAIQKNLHKGEKIINFTRILQAVIDEAYRDIKTHAA